MSTPFLTKPFKQFVFNVKNASFSQRSFAMSITPVKSSHGTEVYTAFQMLIVFQFLLGENNILRCLLCYLCLSGFNIADTEL